MDDFSAAPDIIHSKLEINHSNMDLTNSYRLARLFGLTPEQKSFLFKWLQGLLPTKERLFRMKKIQSPDCPSCPGQCDNTQHIFYCFKYKHITEPVFQHMKKYAAELNYSKLVTLNIQISESLELPFMWLLSKTLIILWSNKVSNKSVSWQQAKADIEADASLLDETQWKSYNLKNAAVVLKEILQGLN